MSNQLDLVAWARTHARRGDPQTSHEAAMQAQPLAYQHQIKILRALLSHGPSTCDELATISEVGLDRHQIGRRMSELAGKNGGSRLVEDSGLKRSTPTGRRAIVWRPI